MRDAIILQHAYAGSDHARLLDLTHDRHADYCAAHDFDFESIVLDQPYTGGDWPKISRVIKALNLGYKYVVWLDADAVILDTSVDLRDALTNGGIGAVWHKNSLYDHWNVGVMYFRDRLGTLEFLNTWADQAPGVKPWFEQEVYNQMANEIKWSCVIRTLEAKWNSTLVNAPCDNPVIMAFHGCGPVERRYKLMKECIK